MGLSNSVPKVSDEAFNFRGDPLYKIDVHCQICGKRRFSPEKVKQLSDPKMTYMEFITYHGELHLRDGSLTSVSGGICENPQCHRTFDLNPQNFPHETGQQYSLRLLFPPEHITLVHQLMKAQREEQK